MQAHTASPTDDNISAVVQQIRAHLESLPSRSHMTDATAEAVYSLAYRDFTHGRYPKALESFKVLLVYRPTNTVYLLGAALCLQRTRSYKMAAAAFTALRLLEPDAPGHTLALAECFLLMHERDEARDKLEQAIDYCQANPGHDEVLARARAMLNLMGTRHESAAA